MISSRQKIVEQLTDVESKKLRNWIAGYVTDIISEELTEEYQWRFVSPDRTPVSIHGDKEHLQRLVEHPEIITIFETFSHNAR